MLDGYQDGPSTKDCTHERRAGVYGPTVTFESMVAKVKKMNSLQTKRTSRGLLTTWGTDSNDLVAQLAMPQGTQIY